MKYFLRKNDQNIETNKKLGTEKFPYFTLFEVKDPAVEGGKSEFKEVAAFWKSKSGKGYTGRDSKPFTKTNQSKDSQD